MSNFHAFSQNVALQLLPGLPDRVLQRVQLFPGLNLKFTDLWGNFINNLQL
jgi:hypothetical protein